MILTAAWRMLRGRAKACRFGAANRVDFDARLRLEPRGTQITPDGAALIVREQEAPLGRQIQLQRRCAPPPGVRTTSTSATGYIGTGFTRLAGFDDVNDANRLPSRPDLFDGE
jgi:hypothetical protein